MAVKSVIDIDVNDEKFKAFIAAFEKYQSALKSMPGAWDDTSASVAASALATKHVTEELEKQHEIALQLQEDEEKRAAQTRKRLDDERKQQKKRLDDAKQAASAVAKTLTQGAARLAEMFSITAVVGTVLGGFGLGRAAAGITDAQRAAAGVGVNVGQRAAFGIGLRPFLASPESYLESIAAAKADPGIGRSVFGRIGISDVEKKDTASLAIETLNKAIAAWEKSTKTQPEYEALGFGTLGLSMEDLRSLSSQRKAVGEATRTIPGMAADLQPQAKTIEASRNFSVAIAKASSELETVFMNALTDLMPPLTELAKAFISMVKDITKSDFFKDWVDRAKKAITAFGDYLKSGEFKRDLIDFEESLAKLGHKFDEVADGILKLLEFLHMVDPKDVREAKDKGREEVKKLSATQLKTAKDVMSDFEAAGFPKSVAAAMAGHAYYESSLDTKSKNKYGYAGLINWSPDRQKNFAEWAKKNKLPSTDIQKATRAQQDAFAIYEINKNPNLKMTLKSWDPNDIMGASNLLEDRFVYSSKDKKQRGIDAAQRGALGEALAYPQVGWTPPGPLKPPSADDNAKTPDTGNGPMTPTKSAYYPSAQDKSSLLIRSMVGNEFNISARGVAAYNAV